MSNEMSSEELTELMSEIDNIDLQIIWLLKDRFLRSRRIGELKRLSGAPPYDPARIESQQAAFVAISKKAGLETGMAAKVIAAIVKCVIRERKSRRR